MATQLRGKAVVELVLTLHRHTTPVLSTPLRKAEIHLLKATGLMIFQQAKCGAEMTFTESAVPNGPLGLDSAPGGEAADLLRRHGTRGLFSNRVSKRLD